MGRALRVFVAVLFVACWFTPTAAQTASQKKPAATGSKSSPATSKSTTKKRTSSSRSRYRGQAKPATERIIEIQSALARTGHYAGEPTGSWDAKSVSSLKSFQESKGLKATGKIDARSLQLLGLGSETAGLGAPREPAAAATSSSSNQ